MVSETSGSISSTCRIIRSAERYVGKQGPSYAAGVSAESAGSQAIWLGIITLAPGARTKAHYHANHETALHLLSGEVDFWFGDALQEHRVVHAGDYLYIPAGVSHVAANRSQTEPAVVVGARTDPKEQESIVLQPELESKLPVASD